MLSTSLANNYKYLWNVYNQLHVIKFQIITLFLKDKVTLTTQITKSLIKEFTCLAANLHILFNNAINFWPLCLMTPEQNKRLS